MRTLEIKDLKGASFWIMDDGDSWTWRVSDEGPLTLNLLKGFDEGEEVNAIIHTKQGIYKGVAVVGNELIGKDYEFTPHNKVDLVWLKKVLDSIYAMAENDRNASLLLETKHKPTKLPDTDGFPSWIEGNRSISITISEHNTPDYYRSNYFAKADPHVRT